jgi:hypothetical protein
MVTGCWGSRQFHQGKQCSLAHLVAERCSEQ